MASVSLLDDLKTDLGIFDNTKDAQLQRLLTKATTTIKDFTRQSEAYVNNNLSEQIINLAIVRYNRKGSEGLSSQSYSGVSEHYLDDIPKPIMRILVEHRKLVK